MEQIEQIVEQEDCPKSLGVPFEQAIVAKGRNEDYKHFGCTSGKTTLGAMAEEAVRQLEKAGVSPTTLRHSSEVGISSAKGDPKTDIVAGKQKRGIWEYRISVKMPGGIQLASGERSSTITAFDIAATDEALKEKVREIEELWKKIPKILISDSNFKKAFQRHMSSYIEGKKKRLPAWVEEMLGKVGDPKELPDVVSMIDILEEQGIPQQEINRAIQQSVQEGASTRGGTGIQIYADYQESIDEVGALIQELFQSAEFKEKYVKEAMTGNNQFGEGSNGAANWILTPTEFNEITDEYVALVAGNFQVKSNSFRSKVRSALSYLVFRSEYKPLKEGNSSAAEEALSPIFDMFSFTTLDDIVEDAIEEELSSEKQQGGL